MRQSWFIKTSSPSLTLSLHLMYKMPVSRLSGSRIPVGLKTILTFVTISPMAIRKLLATYTQRVLSSGGRMKILHYLACFIFLLNIKSAPFAWHCRLLVSFSLITRLIVLILLLLLSSDMSFHCHIPDSKTARSS
jgi:hypothetical protein